VDEERRGNISKTTDSSLSRSELRNLVTSVRNEKVRNIDGLL
jgi:hypothetical protein